MQKSGFDPNRISDKTGLLLKFNYVSSILSLILGFLCLYVLHIEGVVTITFFTYFVLNLVNIALFQKHRNLTAMALYTSILSLLSTLAITLFSGGIGSPFMFILAIIVLAGYISTRLFGKIYLYVILAIIIIIFAIDRADLGFIVNEIPVASRDIFDLASILFAVYLLGGVFGKELLTTHHNLYRLKAEIENRIQEKETLVREVHHRVKNNLQTVSSLLSLQSKNTLNEEIRTLIKSSKNRITAMAMIHEMLYVRDNLSKIEFEPYVRELTEFLVKSMAEKGTAVVHIDIAIPPVQYNLDTAIPLGLLINEVVTNSLKYGFAGNDTGKISIQLRASSEPESYDLRISDNGIGFSEEIDFENNTSLGLKLIQNLARQLRGSVKRTGTSQGTSYQIQFRETET